MADFGERGGGFFSRFSRFSPWGSSAADPVKADNTPIQQATAVALPSEQNGHVNGNGHRRAFLAQKVSNGTSLLPRLNGGLSLADFADFIPLDGNGNTIPQVGASGLNATALAFAAYWFVATRWRAQKIAEAPLMVVEEDQDDGSEEWLADHELAQVLDDPSPDYDMGELLERTSRYLDDGGEALWVMDRDRAERVARLTPFRRGEFTVNASRERLFASFTVRTAAKPSGETFDASKCCYFRDAADGWAQQGRSRLDIAMAWLRLGETARTTIRDLLANAVWPSAVAIPDASWNPSDEDFERYKQELQSYAQGGNKGKAVALLGGGSFEALSARIRDLVPEEVLNRVESVVSAVSGVPAIVLQFQVGMENSPWSQMEQARRMAYDDCIQPAWRRIERVLTRQLLRPDDEDRSHFIRFDRSTIAALQLDRQQAATTATLMGRAATLNERRVVMGLEPSDDPAADEIPELATPMPNPFAPADDDEAGDETKSALAVKAWRQKGVLVVGAALRREAKQQWQAQASVLLAHDATEIQRIIKSAAATKSMNQKAAPDFLERVMAGVISYLRTSQKKWEAIVAHLFTQGAERSLAVTTADLGLSYNSLHPHVVDFAKRHAGELVTDISDTTRKAVANAIATGLAEERTVEEIARLVAESGAFAPSRAKLIAQTESTRASEGGPVLALRAYAKATGRVFVKRWSGMLDEKERDEHVALEGETRPIDQPFSNGLQFPSEPNCRCSLILSEEVAA